MNRAAEQTGSPAVNEQLYALIEGLTDRLHRHEEVRLEEVIAAHPEHADGLRRIWPSLELMTGLRQAAGSSFPPDAGAAGSPIAGEIGDFRIIREVGRGGMGIVYEAEQMSLERRVALKVLPFAGVLDERQLQRFRNEARAAAGLHHPHIVPVHAVGCERGVHFYAMQLIAGRNLAELLDEIRTRHGLGVRTPEKTRIDSRGSAGAVAPSVNAETQFDGDTTTGHDAVTALDPRTVARWIVQAARALDYAHAVGIVHRDIKPSNLLLDSNGQLWIADFGLAQFEADAGLTQSGDILGTLRYMSPEQALGARGVVDQRADVYSLGATLYELLTLAPLYPDANRAELLRCIEEEEPLAPRRGNPAIPVDLETIVLKSLAKDPAARYATAGELADDLQRYLDDRPIKARRPTRRVQLIKWVRRRPAAAALVLVSGLSILALSSLLIWHNRQLSAALAHSKSQEARAQANFGKARNAVDGLLGDVGDIQFSQATYGQQVREQLLRRALEFYRGFLAEAPDDPSVQYGTACAFIRLATLHKGGGNAQQAIDLYQEAIELLQQLSDREPSNSEYLMQTMVAQDGLSLMYSHLLRRDEALEHRRAVLLDAKALVALLPDNPDHRKKLAVTHATFANSLSSLGRNAEAEVQYQQATEILASFTGRFPKAETPHEPLADVHYQYGQFLNRAGRLEEAAETLDLAIHHQERFIAQDPESMARRWPIDRHWAALGQVHLQAANPSESERCSSEAIRLCREWMAQMPGTFDKRRDFPRWLAQLANAQLALDRPKEAVLTLEESLVATQELVGDRPDVPLCRTDLGWAHFRLGVLLHLNDRREAASSQFQAAADLFDDLDRGSYDNCYARAWFRAACPQPEFRDADSAVVDAELALELSNQGYFEHWRALALSQLRAGVYPAALDSAAKARDLRQDGDALASLITALALAKLERPTEARKWIRHGFRPSAHRHDGVLEVLQQEVLTAIPELSSAE